MAEKIAGDEVPQTLCNLDYLSPGEEADRIPDGIVAVDWHCDAYFEPPTVVDHRGDDQVTGTLLDLELVLEPERTVRAAIGVAVRGEGIEARFTFRVTGVPYFAPASDQEPRIMLERGPGRSIALVDYLNAQPLSFFTSDFSSLQGSMFYRAPTHDLQDFDARAIEPVAWAAAGVDIGVEFDVPGKLMPASGLVSIHTYLEGRLAASPAEVVFYDHGSGEAADFVTITREEHGSTRVTLYHCKGAASEGGDRVDDAAEVCMQAVKSVPWLRLPTLRKKIRHRARTRPGKSRFVRGDLAAVDRLLGDGERVRAVFEIVVVQPGFSRDDLSPKLGSILAAANDFLSRAGFLPLAILGSR